MLFNKEKPIQFPTFLLLGIHILFAIFIVGKTNIGQSLWLILISPVYFIFNNKLDRFQLKDLSFDILSFLIGLSLTLWLQVNYNLSSVTSAAAIGVFVAFIPQTSFGIKPNVIKNFNHSKLAVYTGAFAGMTTLPHIGSIQNLLWISIFGGSLYYLLRNSFVGLGGKLGSIGFASIIIHLLLNGNL